MEKLKLTPNVPEIIALEYQTGKECISQLTGKQEFLFSLTDGRQWYLPAHDADKIDRLDLGKGEPFEVVKTAKGLQVAHVEAPPQRTEPAARTGRVARTRDNAEPGSSPKGSNDNIIPMTSAPSPATTGGKMMACLLVAIDSLYEAQNYAHRKGLQVSFTGEDVRTIANTLMIQGEKGGRY